MKKSAKDAFLFELSSALLSHRDSFLMARTFAKLVLKYSKLQSASLIWPDTDGAKQALRTEILGKKNSQIQKIFEFRFRDQGDIYFRIDFFSKKKIKIPAALMSEFRQAHKLVEAAILANEEREQKEELARFQWIRHLSAGLSHELNTPLTTLLFHSKKLVKENESSPSVQQIKNSLNLVEGLLKQYGTLSGDGEFLDFESVSASAVGENLQKVLQRNFPQEYSWMHFKGTDAEGQVSIHSESIERLVLSILKNSVEAIQEKLSVNKDLQPWIEIQVQVQKSALVVKITNNGSEIKPENRPFIFAPFFSTKDVSQGTGLGLSMARAIAFVNNGTLRLNPLAERTQFILEIPLIKNSAFSKRKAA